jgi:hypothetical protein
VVLLHRWSVVRLGSRKADMGFFVGRVSQVVTYGDQELRLHATPLTRTENAVPL